MTKQRDFKKLVRARMAKTGERYATARAQLLGKNGAGDTDPPGVVAGYGPCGGVQSETGILRNVFRHAGLRGPDDQPYSEALVHGLCGGIGFLYAVFEYAGYPPMLTIVGRSRSMPDTFAAEGLARAGAETSIHETGGAKKARADLDRALDAERPAICTVDGAALPYYGLPAEMHGMGPHLVAVIGRAGDDVWLDDRGAQPIRVSMDDLAAARAGYRKGKHRLVTVAGPAADYDLGDAVREALSFTVRAYDEPPAKPFAKNIGTAGLSKWARLLTDSKDKKGWPRVFESGATAYVGLRRTYDCVQHDYAAPDAGRPMFADYLDEAAALTEIAELPGIAEQMRAVGERWAALSTCITECGDDTVARGCALSDRRAELVDARGGDAAAEMAELWRERRTLSQSCTLSADRAREIYSAMAEIVGDIATRERAVLDQLSACLS
ncbi:MAG: BtrH N-terminal domain-containing protein [Myxococcota bacterium]